MDSMQQLIQSTLAKARESALSDPSMKKALTVGSGLVGYNLQAPAHQLVPLMAPFHKTIPRIVKPGANSDNWRVISALSSPNPFTAEAAASSLFTTTLASPTAAFKVLGVRGQVTLEAQRASEGFDPALAKETANTLLLGMKLEEQAFLGATLTALGTPAAPVVTVSTSAGSITAVGGTYFAAVVGLNILASNRATLSVLADINTNLENLIAGRAVTQAELQAIALGATAATGCGMTAFGAIGASGAISPTNQCLKIVWTPLAGCTAYIVFVGTTTGAANMHAEAITTQCQVCLSSLSGAGVVGNDAAVPAADETDDLNAYDGIIPQLCAAGSGAYIANVAGALTGTAAGAEIPELQNAFASIYQTAKIGKFRILMSGIDTRVLSRKGVISNSMIIVAQPTGEGRGNMMIGAHVGEILNATTGDICPIDTEPWLPQGTIIILPMEIPYPDANISVPFQWVGSYDWMRWDYASTTATGPIYPFEARCNGVIESLFPAGCGVLYNVYKG